MYLLLISGFFPTFRFFRCVFLPSLFASTEISGDSRHRQRHFIYRIVQSICTAYTASCAVGPADVFQGIECRIGDDWVPVTTAWSVLRALMEKGLADAI